MAQAEDNPTFTFKYGESFDDSGNNTKVFTISVQTPDCKNTIVCYSASFMRLDRSLSDDVIQPNVVSDNVVSDGVGVDVIYKYPKKQNDSFYIAGGVGLFAKGLTETNDRHINAHVGMGVEFGHIVVSIDAYGSVHKPLYLLNAGIHF